MQGFLEKSSGLFSGLLRESLEPVAERSVRRGAWPNVATQCPGYRRLRDADPLRHVLLREVVPFHVCAHRRYGVHRQYLLRGIIPYCIVSGQPYAVPAFVCSNSLSPQQSRLPPTVTYASYQSIPV